MLVGTSSSAKSDMDMAYERARVHFGSEEGASSPAVGKVGCFFWRFQYNMEIPIQYFIVLISVWIVMLGHLVLVSFKLAVFSADFWWLFSFFSEDFYLISLTLWRFPWQVMWKHCCTILILDYYHSLTHGKDSLESWSHRTMLYLWDLLNRKELKTCILSGFQLWFINPFSFSLCTFFYESWPGN